MDLNYHRFLFNGWKIRIIFLAIAFAMVWTALVYPNIDALISLPHSMQFLLSVGVLLFITYIFGTSVDGSVKKMAGIFCILLAADLLIFPLLVTRAGVPADIEMSGAAIDVIVQDVWESVGIPGGIRWFFVYPVGFVLLIAIGVNLIGDEKEARGVLNLGGRG